MIVRNLFSRFSIYALASILALSLTGPVAAETPTIEPPSESALSLFQKKTLEYALLEYGMLENRRTQGMNPSLQSQLIFVLERLIEVYCMPDLPNTLDHVGPATGADCLHHLKELESMHPDNPVALCARHGIDSDSCKDAYDNQYISRYYAPSRHEEHRVDDSTDFLVRLNVPQNKDQIKLWDIDRAISQYNQEKNIPNRKRVEKVLSLSIRAQCNPTYYRMAYEKPGDELKSSFKEKGREEDPLKKLVAAFSSGDDLPSPSSRRSQSSGKVYLDRTPVPDPRVVDDDDHGDDYQGLAGDEQADTSEKFVKGWRVRYLNSNCIPILRRALEFDQDFPDAICYREGFSAPNCVNALRARRQRAERAAKRRGKKYVAPPTKEQKFKGGFSSF